MNKNQHPFLLAGILGLAVIPHFGAHVWAEKLRVTITGIVKPVGTVRANLFNQKEGFPAQKEKAWMSKDVTPKSELAQIDFDGVPPGDYAVSVYQDLNENGRLDKNFFGIPKEPYGVSNNPKPRHGPPLFEEALFSVSLEGSEIIIKLPTNDPLKK